MEYYKQKYEDALNRAKKYYNRELYAECNGSLVEDIFPELKESEDERIRKGLIQHLKELSKCNYNGSSIPIKFPEHYNVWIAWLEKQGEQNIKMIQWKGDNLREVVEFTGKSPKFNEWFKTWDDYENYVHSHGNIFKLFCEDGSHYEVPEGAWIVKTPDGYNVASKAIFRQKPAWSEEDEKCCCWAIQHFEQDAELYGNLINWLKSIKERMKGE